MYYVYESSIHTIFFVFFIMKSDHQVSHVYSILHIIINIHIFIGVAESHLCVSTLYNIIWMICHLYLIALNITFCVTGTLPFDPYLIIYEDGKNYFLSLTMVSHVAYVTKLYIDNLIRNNLAIFDMYNHNYGISFVTFLLVQLKCKYDCGIVHLFYHDDGIVT